MFLIAVQIAIQNYEGPSSPLVHLMVRLTCVI